MQTETKQNDVNEVVAGAAPVNAAGTAPAEATTAAPAAAARVAGAPAEKTFGRGGQRDFKKNTRRPARRESRVKPEFDQRIINIRRVARVVTGGRRFSFSVALVAGNRKGMVGVGLGKAGDTSLAIEKAFASARKNMIVVHLTKNLSIPHEVEAKYSSSRLVIMPAPGRGIIAGSSVRTVFELAGIKDVGAKVRSGSKNKLNIARSAIVALSKVSKPREKAAPANSSETSGAPAAAK